jgi:hypothetical protein
MATMRFIAVADTLDQNIGKTVQIDLETVPALFRSAAQAAGLGFEAEVVQGDAFRADTIRQVVENVLVEADDVVVFYYSGHGARGESKPDAWPVMALGGNGFEGVTSFDLAWVYAELRARRPRTLVVAVDCCQQEVDGGLLEEQAFLKSARAAPDAAAARALFSSFRGEVLAMSCRPGELSGCDNRRGGLFTFRFRASMERALHREASAEWGAVLSGCEEIAEDQNPIWRVEPRTLGMDAPGLEPFPGRWNCVAGDRPVPRRAAADRVTSGSGAFCTACGAAFPASARFCSKCGTPNTGAPPRVDAVSPAPPSGPMDVLATHRARMDETLARHRARLDAVTQTLAGGAGADTTTRGDYASCPTCGNSSQPSDVFRCSRCSGIFCTCSTVRHCQGRCRCGNGGTRTLMGRIRPRR